MTLWEDRSVAGDLQARLTAPVKMVIWDLDDTLWDGTLSEGPVVLPPGRADLVRTLNRRGIVNAICSKNDLLPVQHELEALGIWDEFVFPRVDWTSKGPRIAQIIEDAQLRPANVLFVDDHPLNLGEAEHFAPGLQTAGPDILDTLLELPELAGKDDVELTRLAQYRILEHKVADRRAARQAASDGAPPRSTSTEVSSQADDEGDSANEDFLRSCAIRVTLHHDALRQADRLHELSLRTNQLNFTKRRLEADEFEALLADPNIDAGYLEVRDRYGDYGICGFYALDRQERRLVDFLFSCRALNMGVEQWLYGHLGRPALEVVGEVVSSLDGEVDWITVDDESTAATAPAPPTPLRSGTILIVGGCDLSTTADFLGGEINTEFAHPGATGAFIHAGHTETLRQSAQGLTDAQWKVVDDLPMVDRATFRSATVIEPDYDVLVLSVLTDYTQGLYRHRTTGLVVPWSQFTLDATDPANRARLLQRHAREGMDADFFDRFADEFEFLGGLTPERFQENITWLADTIPEGATLILVNGAEFPLENPKEPGRHLHHATMNAALDEIVAGLPQARVCDVRTFITSADDFTDHLRHYRRQCYLQMAEEIRSAGASLAVRPEPWAHRAYTSAYRFAGRRKLDLARWRTQMRSTKS